MPERTNKCEMGEFDQSVICAHTQKQTYKLCVRWGTSGRGLNGRFVGGLKRALRFCGRSTKSSFIAARLEASVFGVVRPIYVCDRVVVWIGVRVSRASIK